MTTTPKELDLISDVVLNYRPKEKAIVPLTLDDDADTLPGHRGIHETLTLDAVFFEGRFHDAAPDTDGRDNGILGWNQYVVDIFLVGQRVPAVKPNQIVQLLSVSKPDSSVLRNEHRRLSEDRN